MPKSSRNHFPPACERNKKPILEYLKQWLKSGDKVLEIGSGTGQHGVFFASQLPDVVWQCSEPSEHLDGLKLWIKEANLDNLPALLELDVTDYNWILKKYRAVFSANTLHIMHWSAVAIFLANVHKGTDT